tara:strand:+ start:12605 stop:12880 length:276 start_codon:yes stop_codon:yes gene_type:complete
MSMIIGFAIWLYSCVIILQVALSWLIAFEIVNKDNEAAKNLTGQLKKLTDPVYVPLRKFVPPIGGIDISPLIVLFGLSFLGGVLIRLLSGF